MKTSKLFRSSFFALLLSAVAMWSCTDPKPAPTPDPLPSLVDTYEFEGVRTKIQSVVQEQREGMSYIYLAADKGITKVDQLVGSTKEYIVISVENGVTDELIDLMTFNKKFGVSYMKNGASVLLVTNTDRSKITKGEIRAKPNATQTSVTIDFSMTLLSGKLLIGNITTSTVDQPDQSSNKFVLDGSTTAMESFFIDEFHGSMLVVMSPVGGFESWEDVVNNNHPNVTVMFDKALINQTANLLNETKPFQIVSTIEGAKFEVLSNDDKSAITAGKMVFNFQDNDGEITIDLALASGKTFFIYGTGRYVPVVAEGVLTVNDVSSNIMSSFYDKSEEGYTMLHFSPQQVSNGPQMEDAKTRIVMMLDNTLFDGSTFDITTQTKMFSFAYMDEFGEIALSVMPEMIDGATGTIKLDANPSQQGKFTVLADIIFNDGTKVKLDYDGVCDPYSEDPENQYTLQGLNPKPIMSVVVDKSNPVWSIWLASETGLTTVAQMQDAADPIKLTIDGTLADGVGHGFSTNPTMSIVYAGTTYGLGNEADRGTLSVLIDGDNSVITFKEWVIILDGYYKGAVTIID